MDDQLWSDDEWRAQMSSADINDLPDSAFAYIEPGGKKDKGGKTVPRSLRHFPIHDAAHVRNALARAPQSPFGDKAMPAIKSAAKKFGIEVQANSEDPVTEGIEDSITEHKSRRKPRHRSTPLVPEYRRGQGLQVRRFDMADSGLEVRESKNGSLIKVTGTPIRYGTPYTVRDAAGEFEETMEPGVVTQLLQRGDMDCRFLFNHDGLPLARTTSGTLSLRDSAGGLTMEAQLDPRQQIAQDLAVAIERGDVTQMSCGFIVADDTWTDSQGNPTSPNLGVNRSIHRFDDLLDVSAVTYPASPTTSIDVAARMLLEQPVESRARIRSLWSIAKDIRADQPVSTEDRTALADGLEALATGGDRFELEKLEERDSSTGGCGCCDACTAEPVTEPREDATETEERAQKPCSTCNGFGSCPDCGGSGKAGVDGTQNAPAPYGGVMNGDAAGSRDAEPETEKKSDARKLQHAIAMMKLRRPPQP